MTDWIDEEVKRIEDAENRERLIGMGSERLFQELGMETRQQVEKIYTTPRFERIIKKIEIAVDERIVSVEKQFLPSRYLTFNLEYGDGANYVLVRRRGCDGPDVDTKHERPLRLEFGLDDSGNVCFVTKDGEQLNPYDVCSRFLPPMLVPNMLRAY